MASLEIDISVKGATAGIRNLEKVTSTLEKLDDTIRLVDFNKLNKDLTTIGAVFKSVSANVTGFSTELKRIDSNALKGMFSQTKVDAEKYRAELSRLRVENQELRNSLVQNKAALQEEKLAFEQGKVAQQNYRTETARLQAEITKLRLEQAKNRQQTQAVSGSYKEAQQRLTALGQAIRNYEGGFTRMTPQLRAQIAEYRRLNEQLKAFDKQMGLNFRNIGNYESAFNALGSLSPQLSMLMSKGGGLLGVALAARDAYKTVADFDSGLKNVQKTTGLTSDETAKLGEEFVKLSKQLQTVSAQSLAEYATVAGQLGIKGTKNILAFSEALAKLETASDITGEEGGAQIARLLTLTDGGVQNVKQFSNEIVNLGNNFAATESEILGNATRISQATGVYRLGRENVLAYATATKSIGVEAELVGSTIGRTLGTIEGLSRSTKNAQLITDLLGISQAELQKRFRENSGQVLTDFIKALRDVNEAGGSVNGTLEQLGIRAIRDKTVLGSLATNGYGVLTDAINKTREAGNAADEEFALASTKMSKQTERIGIAWDNLVLSIEEGTGAIGKVSVAFADVTASILDGLSNIVSSNSWKEFFARLGELSSNSALGAASRAAGNAIRASVDNPNGRPRTEMERAVARSVKGFDQASTEEQALRIRQQREIVESRAQEYRARSDKENLSRLTLQSSILAEMNKIYYEQLGVKKKISNEDAKGDGGKGGDKAKGKTQAEIIEEVNRALSIGQVGALRGVEAELLKIDNKYADIFKKIGQIKDLTLRGQLMATAEVNKNIEIGQAKLDGWLNTYKKYGFNEQSLKSVSGNLSTPPIELPRLEETSQRINNVKRSDFADKDLEKRLGRVVERGLRRGIDDIFSNITDLGSNFYEVFSGVFSKLANTVTSTFGQVLSTQLGDLLSSRINNKDFSVGGLGSTASKALVAGGGLIGGILSAQGQAKVNSGLMIGGAALSGAAAGAAFGGIGAAVGAVVGAIAGIFQSAGAKKQQKLQEEALAEQRKQTKLAERAEALSFTSSIVGQQIAGIGIVGAIDRNEFGELVTRVSGSDLEIVLQRNRDKR